MLKKIFTISNLILCFSTLTSLGQWAVVPEAGLNFSKYDFNISSLTSKLRVGYRLGICGHIPLAKALYLQPGILLIKNGYNIRSTNNELNTITNINTLQVPVVLMLKTGKPGKDRFIVTAGAFYALNIAGKYTQHNGHYTTTGELSFGGGSGDALLPSEVGATASLGCEFNNNITAQIYGQRGLIPINPNGDADLIRSQYGISIGYAIGANTLKTLKRLAK